MFNGCGLESSSDNCKKLGDYNVVVCEQVGDGQFDPAKERRLNDKEIASVEELVRSAIPFKRGDRSVHHINIEGRFTFRSPTGTEHCVELVYPDAIIIDQDIYHVHRDAYTQVRDRLFKRD
jgi:hypothetical protein